MANLIHDVEHNFLEFLNPVDQNEPPKDTSVINSVAVLPILPTTKEEMLKLLHEEEKRRLSPEIQQQYYKVGSDPTSGKDWMDVTDQMQHELVREFGYSDEAVQLLRRAPQLYPGKKTFSFFYHCIILWHYSLIFLFLFFQMILNFITLNYMFATTLLLLETSKKGC